MKGNMDIALSARVRLARNFPDMPFPNNMSTEQLDALVTRVEAAINSDKSFLLLRMQSLPARERKLLVERHLISPDLANNEHGAALTNQDETISILIGEEDHLRIQCMQPGMQLEQADALCRQVDTAIGSKLPYAYDNELGYITACPTNLGTGMRASVMVHLPALSLLGQTDTLFAAISKLGYAVRGFYGEGSSAPGHIYQISNQVTLGLLEEDILGNLAATVQRIIEQEQEVRVPYYTRNRTDVEDRVYRSLGTLCYARRLRSSEAMEYISNLKLGCSLGLLPQSAQHVLNGLLTNIHPAALEQRADASLSRAQCAQVRADYVRAQMKEITSKMKE